MKRVSASICTVLLMVAGQAAAQPVPASLGGPAVPGVCLLSQDAVFADSKLGKAVDVRLQQIARDAAAEVARDSSQLDQELEAFRAQAGSLSAAQREVRQREFEDKMAPVQALAKRRQAEVDVTRKKAFERFSAAARPVIATLYAQRNCGLLLERSGVIDGNLSNDLTREVIAGLDASNVALTINREALPEGNP